MKRTMLALAVPAVLLLAACGNSDEPVAVAPAPSTPAAATTTTAPPVAEPALYEVTDAGLTTAVHAPITASPAELSAGCVEAKQAMSVFGLTDPLQMLAVMQATQEDASAGTVADAGADSWANSTPSEQAELIAAIRAAAAGEC